MPKTKFGIELTDEQAVEIREALKSKYKSYSNVVDLINENYAGNLTSTGSQLNRTNFTRMIQRDTDNSQRISMPPQTAVAIYRLLENNPQYSYLMDKATETRYKDSVDVSDNSQKIADIRFEKSLSILPLVYEKASVEIKEKISKGLERLIIDSEGGSE